MTSSAKSISTKADVTGASLEGQSANADNFAWRLREAMKLKNVKSAELARLSGVSPQLVSEYRAGPKVAGADNLFALADALGVDARWLLKGEGSLEAVTVSDEDVVRLPRYDVRAFRDYGKPLPDEMVTIPRAWLKGIPHSIDSLWLTTMPGDAMPDIAAEDQAIICRDPDAQLQDGRVYLFSLEGRLLARRVLVRPGGLVLKAGDPNIDPIELEPDQAEQLIPMARILAAINIEPA